MKHETQTTETFTRVSYTCDLCEEQLLDGQRPRLCGICARETCGRQTCTHYCSLSDDERRTVHVCRLCLQVEEEAMQQIGAFVKRAEEACGELRAAWKQRSLAQKGNV